MYFCFAVQRDVSILEPIGPELIWGVIYFSAWFDEVRSTPLYCCASHLRVSDEVGTREHSAIGEQRCGLRLVGGDGEQSWLAPSGVAAWRVAYGSSQAGAVVGGWLLQCTHRRRS
jgi:hypothetical protein